MNDLRARFLPVFPAKILPGPGIAVAAKGLNAEVGLDYRLLQDLPSDATGSWLLAIQNPSTDPLDPYAGMWKTIDVDALELLLGGGGGGGGSGDVVGPAGAVDGNVALFDGTSGKVIEDGGALAAVAFTGSASDLGSGTLPAGRFPALTGDVTNTAGSLSTTIASGAVSNAKLATMATARFKGRATAGSGDPEDLTATQATALLDTFAGDSGSGAPKGLVPAAASGDAAANKFLRAGGGWTAVPFSQLTGSATASQMPAFTGGDVTSSAGSVVLTIGNNTVTLAKMAPVSTARFLGRVTASTGDVEALTGTQATALLDVFGPDGGAGGVKGLVPATVAGDAAKFLRGNGTWSVPAGAGDVAGPSSAIDGELALYNGTTGKIIKAGGLPDAQYPRLDGTNAGPLGDRNLLVNPNFVINNRAFAGGALAAGVYGYDKWKGGTGGATITASTSSISLAGRVVQPIELDISLAGQNMTISVEDPSGTIDVTLTALVGSGSVNGSITAGSGRRSVTLTVPATATGHLSATLYAASTVTFLRPQIELGNSATPQRARARALEEVLCARYCQVIVVSYRGYVTNASANYYTMTLRNRMVGAPTITELTAPTLTNVSTAVLASEGYDVGGCVRFTITGSAAGMMSAALGKYLLEVDY